MYLFIYQYIKYFDRCGLIPRHFAIFYLLFSIFFSFYWQILEEVEEVVTVYDSEGEGVTSGPAPFQLDSSADPLSYTR